MFMYYFIIFISSVFLAFLLTFVIKKISLKLGIVDIPNQERKIHKKAIPLLGGVAIFLCFFIVLYFVRDELIAGNLEIKHWIGVFIGACFLMIGGFLDDKYNLSVKKQIIFPVLAILSIIACGVNIEKISNPFGGFFYFNILFSGIFIFLWLLGMMYTTKLLDGIDGLVSSITCVGAFVIFIFTMTTKYYQPDIGIASLILTGACFGFLILNWHPAKIFLGEGGSLFLGYILGVLSIISGGKIAIALLIMGLPIMDVAWTIIRRIKLGKNPFKFADRKHLHFRLLDSGLTQRQIVLVFCIFSLIFGTSALFLQSIGKILALGFLILIMLLIIISFSYLDKKNE